MMAAQTIVPITVGDVLSRAEQAEKDGYRLMLISCTKIGDDFEIIYTYDKDFVQQNYRITVKQDTVVPSISGVYFGAFVYENEIHDLYGIAISGINIDFKGTFYRTAVKYPFSVTITKEDDTCQNR